jgi:hypothetical protein
MAAITRTPDLSTKQARAAAKVAGFKAEQVRLKDAAAKRRAAIASRPSRASATPARSVGRAGRQGQR